MTRPSVLRQGDAALVVAASRARTQQHVLAGLIHDLNGPLNNLGLTLDLLERVLSPRMAGPGDDGARLRRYLDTLRQEVARLAAWSHGAAELVHAGREPPPPAAPSATLEEARRLLRHHATLAEVRLEIGHVDDADARVDDPAAVRAALIAFVCAAVALAEPGGSITLESFARVADVCLRIVIAPARASAEALRAFAAGMVTPESPVEGDLLAGRITVQSLRGTASLERAAGRAVIELTLPRV